ncbi:MAG: MurT ligase domain-containing protein [Eubacterium sp.]|jgi:UDP-N-acetylmuramyl tripeptide synthase
MSRIRYGLALLAAKLSVVALRVTRHNGTNFPGVVAIKICPDFLRWIRKPGTIIGITGTNGKTTVSNLSRDLMEQLGRPVLNNSAGSNINTGIATCLIHGVTFFGRPKYDTAVLEIDERSARLIFPYIQPDILMVTNLSRDSIMRNGHPEYIKDILTRYMPKKTRLLLNADNLISTMVAPENPRVCFGIDRLPTDKTTCSNRINDMQICPRCSSPMKYEYIRYSNVGRAYCPNCGFSSPKAEYHVTSVDWEDRILHFVADTAGAEADFPIVGEGLFNIYNETAVIALFMELGYSIEEIRDAMGKVRITASRYGVEKVGDITILQLLGKDKNAYGTSRVLEYIHTLPGDKEILLYNNSLTDAAHWSENTCWLYDCDFELLADSTVKRVIVYGDRAKDYKLRLLMAGVPEDRIVEVRKPEDGIDHLLAIPNETICIIYGTGPENLGARMAGSVKEKLRNREQEVKA